MPAFLPSMLPRMHWQEILDDRQVVLAGDLHQRRHVGHLPGEMDRNQRLGLLGDPGLDLAHVHAEVVGAVDKDRTRKQLADRADGRDEGVGGRDDLVARPDAQRLEAELDRVGARVHADGLARADHRGELLLELAHRLAEREVAGRHELAEQVEDLFDVLGAELLGQIGPLNLVAVGLRRQVDARHSGTILISGERRLPCAPRRCLAAYRAVGTG